MTALPVADSHNDLLLAVRHLRERGHDDPFGAVWLPQLQAGGVRVQVLPVCTEEQFVGEGALRRALLMIEEARILADRHSDAVAIVETAADLNDALEGGRIALVLAIEGAEPVGHSLELLATFYRAGVRMASLSWNRRTMMADGIAESDTGGRLTSLGADAVRFMQQLGMIVDVSHLSKAGFHHLVEVSERPFVASHSSCDAVHAHPRNLDDDQLRAIAAADGLVCVNAFGPFLAEDAEIDDYLRHVEHAIGVVGTTRVGFGTDFIEDVAETVDPIFTGLLIAPGDIPHTRGLRRPADFVALTTRLSERVGSELARAVAFENLTAFLRRELP
ncbi:dipeptidase [Agromyces aerolatus]|uniref:dipeptidase n=1 Tax=Agromyces sp. LY-1074 TaxID=3074080 RepID=UPI002859B9F3|nr:MULTISPECIES: membrane dipeptidase [unclassified Agromyces]MDR5699335.1 membrane dipeptidase [Agromyces sp. LY-1074]MDR5705631.1 membrane dipeptidase [Agromyces sp. LY-1358]